ncbi:unnamed protein product [Urochloa humidicola]
MGGDAGDEEQSSNQLLGSRQLIHHSGFRTRSPSAHPGSRLDYIELTRTHNLLVWHHRCGQQDWKHRSPVLGTNKKQLWIFLWNGSLFQPVVSVQFCLPVATFRAWIDMSTWILAYSSKNLMKMDS